MSPGKLHATRREGSPVAEVVAEARTPQRSAGRPAEWGPEAVEGSGELAAALAAMPPFYVIDPAGHVRYANAAYLGLARKLLGVEPDPSNPPLMIPFAEIVADLDGEGKSRTREIELGQETPYRLRARHAGSYDAEGMLTGISGQFEDIRELHAARRKLALTHERLEDITRLASDWIWETDSHLAVTFVSPRVTEVLGFQPIELIGRSLLELGRFVAPASDGAHPLDPKRRTPFRDAPFTMRHRDGTTRLFHLSSLPAFCPATGDFLGFRGTARDITEQEAASDRAAQSQRQLVQAIESISEGFSLFDHDDRLILCNSKFRGLFPHSAARLVPGASFAEIIGAAVAGGDIDVPQAERPAWLANRLELRNQPRASFEIRLCDGRWVRVSDHKTADGSTVGIRTDITDLKHREEALFQAKEVAEIANRSKSEFLANISHELRTPLNAIIGFSEIMREQIFGPLGSPQYVEYTGDVLDSAHHLLEVINDILDIAKAEAGKLELAEDEVDVRHVVTAATRLVQERAQRNSVAIRSLLAADLPTLLADERKLKQILLNLLTNAIKFTPPDGLIEVAAHLSESGDFLVSVTDTGIGIAADDIETALAPFGQVDSKLNRKYEGTGLGLPLCNAMAHLHGGELTIDSVVGKGTRVTIRLPASRVRKG